MSCIKFPSSRSDLSKSSNKESVSDYSAANSQLISNANQKFGQGNWSHSITNQTIDFIDFFGGKYQVGCASIIRIQLDNGIFHEDIGYSNSEGSTKGSAIQKARFGSYHYAFKKTLMFFENEVTNKIDKISSRPSSPMPPEVIVNKIIPVEASTSTTVEQIIPTESSMVTAVEKIDNNLLEENILSSQTDALMDIVDLDEICSIDQNSNTVTTLDKEIKVNLSKPATIAGSKFFSEKEKLIGTKNVRKEIITDAPKLNHSAGISNLAAKNGSLNSVDGLNTDIKPESLKVAGPAMPENELEKQKRLERKRKQKELQEAFKKQQESKIKIVESENKPIPNPRY